MREEHIWNTVLYIAPTKDLQQRPPWTADICMAERAVNQEHVATLFTRVSNKVPDGRAQQLSNVRRSLLLLSPAR